jgi:hypothetical protein
MAPYDSIHYSGHTFLLVILYLLQRSLWLFFLDSENKEEPVDLWKLRLGGFIAFVIYVVTPFRFVS